MRSLLTIAAVLAGLMSGRSVETSEAKPPETEPAAQQAHEQNGKSAGGESTISEPATNEPASNEPANDEREPTPNEPTPNEAAPNTSAAGESAAEETAVAGEPASANESAVHQGNGASDGAHPLSAEFDALLDLQDKIRMLLHSTQHTAAASEEHEATRRQPDRQPPEQSNAVSKRAAADMLYRLARYSEAFTLYEQSASVSIEEATWILFQRANCLRHIDRLNDAANVYQQIVTEYPDSFWGGEAGWWIDNIQWKLNLRQQ